MFPPVRTRTRAALLRAVDRAIEFATLGEYGLEDPGEELLESRLVDAATATSHLPPDRVGAVVELDGREEPLVVGEALGEAPRAHGVVVLTRPREQSDHPVLERVVDEGDEAQQRSAFAGLPRPVYLA